MDNEGADYLRSSVISDYVNSTSFRTTIRNHGQSKRQNTQNFIEECDFLAVVTAISKAYSCGEYIGMLALNDIRWNELPGGTNFHVSRSTFDLAVNSVFDQSERQSTTTKLIVKRVRHLNKRTAATSLDLGLFVRELSILHHLRHHENIVQLRGVGWDYDCLHDSDLTPCPKPALLIDEADGTLQWLIDQAKDLSLRTEMQICRDVANGLLAVHSCNLVHGDIKPENVLVFVESRIEEGVQVPHFKCKLSDFSHARIVGTGRVLFDWGTRLYMAPEQGEVPCEELQLTDVWSLGILFAAVTQRQLSLKQAVGNFIYMELVIRQALHESIQNSTWDPRISFARQAMFDYTLRQNPQDRDLKRVVEALEEHPELGISVLRTNQLWIQPEEFRFPLPDELFISYENFKWTSGQVHDLIVASLEHTSATLDDPRRRQALFELAVITLSDFAGPAENPIRGLQWLQQSARLKDVRAQGLFYRIRNTIDLFHEVMPDEVTTEELDWLEESASLGHEIAMEDLRALDQSRAERCRVLTISRFCEQKMPVCSDDTGLAWTGFLRRLSCSSVDDSNDSGDTRFLKRSNSFLRHLVGTSTRDTDENTPLILASRFANYDLVIELLDLDADHGQTNVVGENFLHFGGEFSAAELRHIISKIRPEKRALILLQNAKGIAIDHTLELFPQIPGTPLERAIAKNNGDAVGILLDEIKDLIPSNGQVLRRSLLLALRLQHVAIQKIVIQFIQDNKLTWAPDLRPLHETRWEFKGQKRTYLDAAAIGGVSGYGLGADLPLKWWRLCRLGDGRATVIRQSIEEVLSLADGIDIGEELLDKAVPLVFEERFPDSFEHLIELKATITKGSKERLRSLQHLTWTDVEPPRSVADLLPIPLMIWGGIFTYLCLAFQAIWFISYHVYRLSGLRWLIRKSRVLNHLKKLPKLVDRKGYLRHYLIRTFGFLNVDLMRRYYLSHPSPQKVLRESASLSGVPFMETLKPWQTLQTETVKGILERPMETVNYVDQVFYNDKNGTLLQQALKSGDRAMFHLLIHILGANIALPAPGAYVGSFITLRTNAYSMLSHTSHCDLWFAREMKALNIHFDLPFHLTPWSEGLYLPPLFHAMRRCRWPYAQWLMHHGASLEQQMCLGWNVLEFCMTVEELHCDLLEFLFPLDGDGCVWHYLPNHLKAGDGHQVFEYIYKCDRARRGEYELPYLPLEAFQPLKLHSDDLDFVDESRYGKKQDYPSEYGWISRTRPIEQEHVQQEHKTRFRTRTKESVSTKQERIYSLLLVQDANFAISQDSRIVQCWRYLFERFPEVIDSPERTTNLRFSFPLPRASLNTKMSVKSWWTTLILPIPCKGPSIMDMSLRMSSDSSALFNVTLEFYQQRAKLRPEHQFPAQSWLDLLQSSPLDVIPVCDWTKSALRTRYGYWPSINDWLFRSPLLILILSFLCLGTMDFAWGRWLGWDRNRVELPAIALILWASSAGVMLVVTLLLYIGCFQLLLTLGLQVLSRLFGRKVEDHWTVDIGAVLLLIAGVVLLAIIPIRIGVAYSNGELPLTLGQFLYRSRYYP